MARLVGMVARLVEDQEVVGLEEVVDLEEGVITRVLEELGEEGVVDLEEGLLARLLEEQDVEEVARLTEDENKVMSRKQEQEQDEVARLAAELGAMFPSTPAAYLVYRCEDLVGREAATQRLVLELLEDPLPRPGWADLECPCCLDPDCLEERMVACAAGHLYCAACLNAAAAIATGGGLSRRL